MSSVKSTRRAVDDPDRRRKEIAKIHLQAKQLGLDDEVRRQVIFRLTGKRSSADLTAHQRRSVLDYFARQIRPSGGSSYPGRPHNLDAPATPREMKKIEAFLAEAGRPWSYADAIAKRVAGVDSCAFLSAPAARKVLAALSYDAKRHGRRTQ